MDFGIARSVDSETLTGSGTVVGSASYLAPEQVQGLPADHRSDLYALGCVLYEALTGRPPFTGPSAVSVAHKHVSSEPVPLHQIAAVPPDLGAVVMRALAKDPGARHQSAARMRAALSATTAGPSEETRPMAPLEPTLPLATVRPRTVGWGRVAATGIVLAFLSFLVAFALVRLSVF
jgi:serine/threonine protein kinase